MEFDQTSVFKGSRGTYKVTDAKPIGKGGVGNVFKVERLEDNLQFVLKLMHGERFEVNDRSIARFKNESELLCSCNSDLVVRGIDSGVDERDLPFLVMEYVRGGNLADRIQEESNSTEQILRWMSQLLKGFIYLKKKSIVHRDLHPKNILIDENDRLKISDFGIAKDLNANSELTLTIDKLGSLLYISEFQRLNAADATSKDDFYSLCIIMYELVSAKRIHTIAPTLASLPQTKVPVALARLIDAGISYSQEWESILSELCVCLDLSREELSEDYEGSEYTPDWRLSYDAKNYLINGKEIASKIGVNSSIINTDNALLDQVAQHIANGFNKARAELLIHNIHIEILNEVEAQTQNYSASLSGEYYEVLQKADATEEYEDRFYGWILYMTKNNGQTVKIEDINGKRLYADLEKLPEDIYSREITKLDQETILFLFRVGHTLGYGVAYAALERFVDVLEAKADVEE